MKQNMGSAGHGRQRVSEEYATKLEGIQKNLVKEKEARKTGDSGENISVLGYVRNRLPLLFAVSLAMDTPHQLQLLLAPVGASSNRFEYQLSNTWSVMKEST